MSEETASNRPSPSRQPARDTAFAHRLLDNLPGMAYRCLNDRDWTMQFVSRGAKALTGLPPHTLTSQGSVPYARLIHPDDREDVWEAVQKAISEGRAFQITYRIRRADGVERWVWEQGVGVAGPDGDVEAIEGFITDITERVDLARTVRDKEVEHRALVDQPLTGVYVIRGGRFTYVNRRLAEIFGYDVDEMLAMDSVGEVVHPDDRRLVEENLAKRVSGELDTVGYELRGTRKDGSRCDVEVHGRRIETGKGPAVMGILLDITERRRAQRRYHEAQKMESLGRLAAGIAHDFKNVLAVIKATAQLMQPEFPDDSSHASDLSDILDAVDRGAALSRRLSRFGRSGSTPIQSVSLSRLIQEAAPVLERTLPPDIELVVSVERDLPTIDIDPSQVDELVTNLVFNARDAMSDGGTLILRTCALAGGPVGGRPSYRDVAHVVLEVVDTGEGIPEDIRQRIFEPYFTTKDDDGTGLGLANVWRICHDAGGWVSVESEVGVGTTFRAFFPTEHPEGFRGHARPPYDAGRREVT